MEERREEGFLLFIGSQAVAPSLSLSVCLCLSLSGGKYGGLPVL